LHFVGFGTTALGHWLWEDGHWQLETPPSWFLSSQQDTQVKLLAATVNKQGKMMVVFAENAGQSNVAERKLLYSIRALELSTKQPAVQQVPTQTLLTPSLTPTTPTLEPSPTPVSTLAGEPTNSQGQPDRNESNDPLSPFIMAILPVSLLLLGVLGFVIRRSAQLKDR
jgi:hypothetical protein